MEAGRLVGSTVGEVLGVGGCAGSGVGWRVGTAEGAGAGERVSRGEGTGAGAAVGLGVGYCVGPRVCCASSSAESKLRRAVMMEPASNSNDFHEILTLTTSDTIIASSPADGIASGLCPHATSWMSANTLDSDENPAELDSPFKIGALLPALTGVER